jgi:acyl-CoA dehydrogenase
VARTSLTDAIGHAADITADTEDRHLLREVVARMIADVSPPERIREIDEAETFDRNLHGNLAKLGVLALGGPVALGGDGDVRDQLVVIEELAAGPTSMAVFMIVHYMGVQLLSSFGTADQQASWLAPLLSGELKFSFALTEPDGGTDIARTMRTSAARVGDGWRLSGQKTWISGARLADFFIVLARTAEPTASAVDGITMFLVPSGCEGIEIRELPTVAVHGLDTCEVHFRDVRLGSEAVVGAVHQGFRQVLATLNRERLNTAAGCLGAGRGAFDAVLEWASDRRAFGRTLGSMQAVQHRLVDGAMALESARGLMIRAAAVEAAGGRADLLSSLAKLAASEAAAKVTQDGMVIFGAAGFSRELPMQRWFRDVRLWLFAPLTNDMIRNYLGERYLGFGRSY